MDDEAPTNRAEDTSSIKSFIQRKLGKVDPSFYIVGVGASAGGLEAIKQLIGQAPEAFSHTFVAIQHISPDYKSLMPEILARETRLPVREVIDDMAVEPGHIYLIPPKSNVIIQGTGQGEDPSSEAASEGEGVGLRFSLVPPMPRPQLNLPIDLFFHSLAEAVGDRAIAIILSGTGTDGSRGLRGIKDRDGFVLVQDPDTANFDGMPNSAIATNLVDIVTSPDSMIAELQRYISMREDGIINVDALFRNAGTEFKELLALISDIADIDFAQYKEPTLKRRIARRVGLNHFSSVREYTAFARERPSELATLHREFLVGVTNFFRDLPSWNMIRSKVIPELFANGSDTDVIKVWSVGCSTGEEPYTIAMLMEDYRLKHNIDREFRVFATDVNADAIRSAKAGIYPESVIEEIPPEFHGPDYINFHSGTFHISKSIRSRVIFSEHNALEDPPYINTDLLICRNVLIYLSSDMQKKVLSLFSFSTHKNGFLFLGAAEHVARQSSNFEVEHSSARIYRNARKPKRGLANASSVDRTHALTVTMPRGRRLAARESQRTNSTFGGILGSVLGQLDGCVFLIDETGHILESFGGYKSFLVMPDRAFSSNIYDVVHDRLKSAVSLQVRRAADEGSAHILGVKCSVDDAVKLIDVYCSRVEWEGTTTNFSVMLRNSGTLEEIDQADQEAGTQMQGADRDAAISRLESEIESLQEMLSVTAEDLGVANEELQTTNEELTVSNEELQANNEEMQSINEELHTVNAENAEKIAQLMVANADIENLLDNADLGIVFLDEDLSIRRFNATFTRYVDLTDGDLGRRLTSFAAEISRDGYAMLLDDIERARDHGHEALRDVVCRDGTWAQARVRPFRTSDQVSGGVVLSLIDTTRMHQLTEEVQMQRDRLAGLLESEAAGYWDRDLNAGTEYLSPRFKAMFGYRDEEIENKSESWMRLIHPEDLPKAVAAFEAHTQSGGKEPYDLELRYFHKDGSIIWVICRGRVVEWNKDGTPQRMLGVHVDITRLKEREMVVNAEAEEVRRFAFAAAHDLLQPTTTIERGLDDLTEEFSDHLSPESRKVMGFLNQAAARMRARIHGVLDFAHVFDEDIPLDRVDLNTIAHNSVEEFRPQIDELGIEVVIKELPAAMSRESLVPRLFQNLVSNALKYRRPRGKCRVLIEPAPAEPGMVAIRVADNGIGIPPQHRSKLFAMFARLHTEAEYEGIGVGLALCERIMKLSHGRIVISDGIDGGTAFICTFPAVKPGGKNGA
ncbi:MAG: chemotaxis protein CheB [Pseudomonadota bacterium]